MEFNPILFFTMECFVKLWLQRAFFASGKQGRVGILVVRLQKDRLGSDTGVPSVAALLLHRLYNRCSRVACEISMQ